MFDLLNDRKVLNVREDGKKRVNVVGLLEFQVRSSASRSFCRLLCGRRPPLVPGVLLLGLHPASHVCEEMRTP